MTKDFIENCAWIAEEVKEEENKITRDLRETRAALIAAHAATGKLKGKNVILDYVLKQAGMHGYE